MKPLLLLATLTVGLAAAHTPAFADSTVTNGILSLSPASAPQGMVGVTVTFNLSSTSVPPLPQVLTILPTSALIGTNRGAALARPSLSVVTAQFTIAAAESVGLKDATVSFPFPGGTLTYSRPQAFQVLASSGAPVAGFTATPPAGTAPLAVSFTDASGGAITNRLWDFGDGAIGTNLNPTHTYTNLASYTVSLSVFGPGGTNQLTRVSYIVVTTNLATTAIVDTAQTNCYNTTGVIAAPSLGQSFCGQDAQFFGNQPSYALSGDGQSVLDNNTGLMWMRGPNTNLAAPLRSDKMTLAAARA